MCVLELHIDGIMLYIIHALNVFQIYSWCYKLLFLLLHSVPLSEYTNLSVLLIDT